MFSNMYRARAFARCMGDDMEKSNAGFRDPFADGSATVVDETHTPRRRNKPWHEEQEGDEVLDLEDIYDA